MQANTNPDWAAIVTRLHDKYGSDALVLDALRACLPGKPDSYRNQIGNMRKGRVQDPPYSVGAALVWLDSRESPPVPAAPPVLSGLEQRVAALEAAVKPIQADAPEKLPELVRNPPARKQRLTMPAKFSGEWTPDEIAVFRAYLGLGKKELAVLIGYDGVSAARRITDLEDPARREVTRQRVREAFNWLYDLAAAGKPLEPYPHPQAQGNAAEDQRFDRLVEKFGSLAAAARAMRISASYLSMAKAGTACMTDSLSGKMDAALME